MTTNLAGLDLAIVGVYLAAMLGLGAWLSRRIHGFKDYFLADGALTTPLLVCTLVSTYYELDVTFAVSEQGYYYGLVSWFWLSRPYYVAIILAALLVAPRLKRHPFYTLPDLLEHHYGKRTRVLGAVACLVYSLPVTAVAGMTLLFQTLGWSPVAALATTVGVCVVYTSMGGLWADAISDTVQFVLMCVTLAIAIPYAVQWVGGFSFPEALPAEHMTTHGGLSPWLIVAWTVGALTVFVEPAFYQRVFAAKNISSVRNAMLVGVALWAAYDWGVTIIGMLARAAVEKGLLPAGLEGKRALLEVSLAILPVGLKGLFLGGLLAAAMSSVDSYCLLGSGNLVYDIARPLARRPIPDRILLRATRAGIFVVMAIAVWVSLVFQRITDAWVFLAGTLASVVFVPAMGALFGRPRRRSGLLSAGAGLAGLVLFHVAIALFGVEDADAESWVWRIGGVELWREYAVLFALPASALGYLAGQAGRDGESGPRGGTTAPREGAR